MKLFATAAKGTEGALRDELRELRFAAVRADRGGVHFEGGLEEALRACLLSRIAVRILVWLARFPAPNATSLYEGVRDIDFAPYVSPKQTLAVRASGTSPGLVHTHFIAQKAKDAIVDQIRDKVGQRPSVSRDDADVELFVHLGKGEATVYLDASGCSLHRRGYRTRIGTAPIKETLAAAVLRLSGWDRRSPLVDPMCGSGTIAIEAALWARDMAPGLLRSRFGVERWASADPSFQTRARDLRDAARAAALSDHALAPIFASDVDDEIVQAAEENAKAAAVDVTFTSADVRTLCRARDGVWEGPNIAFVVTNPPYGERLRSDPSLYKALNALSEDARSRTLALLAGGLEVERAIGRKPSRWLALFNGAIECRLLVYNA